MLSKYLFKRPLVPFSLMMLLVLPSLYFLTRIEHASLRTFESDDHTARSVMEAVGHRFVPDDLLIIAYEAEDVFDPKILAFDRALAHKLDELRLPLDEATWARIHEDKARQESFEALGVPLEIGAPFPVALDVLSLTRAKDAFGTNSAFSMHPLVEDPIPTDRPALEETRRRAHANRMIASSLVSKDDRVAAIVISLNPYLSDPALIRSVQMVRSTLDEAKAETGLEYHLMGHAVTEADFQTYATQDLKRYTPVTAIVALALCYAFTLSWWSVFALGTIILSAQIVALGVMPMFGFTFNPLSVGISPASIILSGSTLIHFMGEAGNTLYGAHRSWEEARKQVFESVLRPAFLCCLFTAIGFFSVYVSAVPAIREFGMAAAIVTGTSFVITILGVAWWWSWWPVELFVRRGSPAISSKFQDHLGRLCGYLVRRPSLSLGLTLLALFIGVAGMRDLEINENSLEYYPKSSTVRVANDFIEQHLAGTEQLAVVVEKDAEGTFGDPAELRKIDAFVENLRKEPWVDSAISIADYIKLMRQAVYGESPEEHRIPDTREQVGLLLGIGGEERIREVLDEPRKGVRISIRSKVHDTKTLTQYSTALEAELAKAFPASEGYRSQVVGISRVFAATTALIARAEVESLSLTAVVIVGLIMIIFRSVSVGLLSILPNAVPVLFVLGFMGWIGKPITVGNSMICGIAFGVAVEDTIHLIEGYRERLRMRESIEDALDYAFRVKAPAGIWTSLMLAFGFLALGLATFQPVSDFGVLLSVAVSAALIGNLIVLPTTILLFRSRCGIPEMTRPAPRPTSLRTAGATALLLALAFARPASAQDTKPKIDLTELDPADRSKDWERPPEGCLDMDDPRAKNPDDPRAKKYGVKICCLDPADPRAANPNDPRRKKFGVELCCLKPDHPWAQNPEDPRRKKFKVELCCIEPDHPWAQNPDDPRRKKFKIQLCCLKPEHPWAQNPEDPRLEQWGIKLCCLDPKHPWARNPADPRRKKFNVRLCGPDIKSLMADSNRRHALREEVTDVKLVLISRNGAKTVQVGRMARVQEEDMNESLWYQFSAPADIKGLTLLTLEKKEEIQQWLYLPAFGKVRRLGSADLRERFGDTDFLYEDLKRHAPEDYEYDFLEMQGKGEDEHYVFSATPRPDGRAKDSPYAELKVWLRKSDLFITKVQEFDRNMRPMKEMRFEDIKEVAPGVLRADRIVCLDIQRKHQTAVVTTSRKIKGVLPRWLDPATFHE